MQNKMILVGLYTAKGRNTLGVDEIFESGIQVSETPTSPLELLTQLVPVEPGQ